MIAPEWAVVAAAALVAAYAGLALFRKMADRQFNKAVYLLLIASGISLIGGVQA